MAEISGEHGQQPLDIFSSTIPVGKPMHGEGVAQIMEAWFAHRSASAINADRKAQLIKRRLDGAGGKRSSRPGCQEERASPLFDGERRPDRRVLLQDAA